MCQDSLSIDDAMEHYLVPPKVQQDVVPAKYILHDKKAVNGEPQGHSSLAFEAAEHQAIANGLVMKQVDGSEVSAMTVIATVEAKPPVKLTFGRIIALAGDFYTNREGKTFSTVSGNYPPICGAFYQSSQPPTKRFENAVKSLIEDQDGFLVGITKLLDQEHHTIDRTLESGGSASSTYHHGELVDGFEADNCKLPSDKEFFDAMKSFKLNPLLSMYAWLAYTNADHFGEDAVKAYCVGHAVALRLASEARTEADSSEKWKKLNLAYIHEAFAAHYLTDLFSAGHVRAPRRHLHTTNPLVMAAAMAVTRFGKPEIPVWDLQQRYMHDDDCATGLLVRNEDGEEWIAYGDKQFFEPKNAINRARSMMCLQASVNEVFEKGYQKGFNPIIGDGEDDWKVYRTQFDACKLLPIPMTAAEPRSWVSGWGNYEMHNPAPLWTAGHTDQDWTFRQDINDHSNFKRAVGLPSEASFGITGLSARPECIQIRDAPFRGNDQFAKQIPMAGLLSGGFIQVQDLQGPTKGSGTCLNFWTPATVTINDEDKETFTIRNRLIDVLTPLKDLPNEAVSIHWSLRNDFKNGVQSSFLAGFYWTPGSNGSTSSIHFSEIELSEELPPDAGSDVSPFGKQITFDPSRSWMMRQVKTSQTFTLSQGLPPGLGHANMTRFVVDKILPMEHLSPDFFSVTALSDHKVHIAGCNPESPKANFNAVVTLSTPFQGFVKAFTSPHATKKLLLLVNASYKDSKAEVDIYEFSFERQNETEELRMEHRTHNIQHQLNNEGVGDSPVLIGDVLGRGNDQIVIINGDFDNPDIRLYTRTPTDLARTNFDLSGKGATMADEYDSKLVRPYITALVPSCTGKGLDILQISLRQRKGKKYLSFVTHLRSKFDAESQDTLTWYDRKESKFEDPLANSESGQYFHIKFIRTTYRPKSQGQPVDPRHAVLEVFSWYGVLGVRLFVVGEKGYDYDAWGQQPFLGQTSIGAGLGSSGDWGGGYLTWASEDEWDDVAVFKPKSKDRLSEGTWGMAADDLNRQHIRGFEVERRPLR